MAWTDPSGENVIIDVEVIGAREAAASLDTDAAAMERLGLATKATGAEMENTGRRSFLMQQSIFTLRRLAYGATLGFGALAAGAVYMGLKFDASMEQNTVTMSHFLGSVTASKQELQTLFQIAAHGPFTFSGITGAAKQFLAFGFTVGQTNRDLKTIQDTAAAFGGSDDVINRIVLAIGQMQAKGKVMGQELRQLQEVGVPALQILQQQLGLTNDQVNRIGTTGIKASVAIPALIKGLQERYGGLAEAQSKTLLGQLSTLRDYTAQTLGVVMKPLFDDLEKNVLPTAVMIATAIQKGFGQGGMLGSLQEIERSNAPEWFKQLYATIYQLVVFIRGPLREGLGPVAKDLLYIAGAAVILLGETLKLLNELDHFHHIVGLLITVWVTYKLTTMAIVFWNSLLEKSFIRLAFSMAAGGLKSVAGAARYLWNLMRYGAVLEGEVMLETEAMTVAYGEQTVATEALTVAQTELDAALFANPIGLIILGVLALTAAFVVLYLKSATFRGFINSWAQSWITLFTYIKDSILWVIKHVDELQNKIAGLPGYGLLRGALHVANVATGLADGGTVVKSGLSWVGERGPELMWLPQAAQVKPMDHMGMIGGGGGGAFTSHTTIVLDRKVVGEASAKYQLDEEAKK